MCDVTPAHRSPHLGHGRARSGYDCDLDAHDPGSLHEQTGSAAPSPSDSADFASEVEGATDAVLARVSARSTGQPYHQVLAELSSELEAALITMPETWLRRAAEDIAAGRRPHR